ncbi:hypothetical protein [Aquimarina agarivorans]|uniref:hypothetical protein n=1 Tax=Aquimarina agarivorans TaxID=980584 RepID=UPI000248E7EC|nr:hypothetical protein [Aquimarina agarivorans]
MKKMVKLGLLGVAFAVATVANAAEKMNVKVLGSKALNVSLSGVAEGESLSIIDKSGITLFTEKLSQTDVFEKTFDLTYLPEGVYFLESNEDKKINVSPILIANNKVSLISGGSKTYNEPRIAVEGSIAKVILDNATNSEVVITVKDADDTELLRSKVLTDSNIYKKLDFSALPKGVAYTITIKEDDYYFIKEINL